MNKADETMKKAVENLLFKSDIKRSVISEMTGIGQNVLGNYANGKSVIGNMTFDNMSRLYNYHTKIEEEKKMANYQSIKDVDFNGVTLQHSGWSGGDVLEESLFKQFYTTKRGSLSEGFNHYAVWWDLSTFFKSEEDAEFDWPTPHSIVNRSEDAENIVKHFSGSEFTPYNKGVEFKGIKMSIINRPVIFAPSGGEMRYFAGATGEDGKAYQVYWNVFNIIDPYKIEMTVDNSKRCKHCLQSWMLKETKCVRKEGHEFKENKERGLK